jgi:MFS family permease
VKRGYILFLLFLINLLNFYDRQIIAAVTEPIRREFSLTDSMLGWLGTAFTLFYAAVGLPLGRLADTWSRTRVIGAGVAVWSIFTAASGAAWNFWALFLARMGVGLGEASCSPASNSLIGDLFPPERRARAIGLFMLGLPVGVFLSNLLSGLIARSFGWRMAFFVATIPGLVLAVLVFRVKDRTRTETPAARQPAVQASESRVAFFAPFAQLLRIPTFRWVVISGALHNFNAYAVNAFMPAYLMRYHGLSLAQANVAAAFTLGAVGVVSLVVGGIAADSLRARRVNGRLLLGASALLISTPCVYLALSQPSGAITPFVVLMGIGWMLFYLYYVTVYPSIHDVVPAKLRGSAMALYFFWMYVLGGAFGTSILGMLSDRFAQRAMRAEGVTTLTESARATGLHDAFFIVPVLSLLLAVVLFAASRSVERDTRIAQAAA